MSEKIDGINWRSWTIINGLKKGVVVTPTSLTDDASGSTMTIVGIELNRNNLADSMVKLKMDPKQAGKRYRTARAWWVLENTNVIDVEEDEQ